MSIATASYILASLFAIGGGLSLLAAIANWDWFFSSESVRMFTWSLSRSWQRIIYAALGIAIIAMAITIILRVPAS